MSLPAEIEVREIGAGDQDGILELVRLALGPGSTPRTPAFWRWKHELNPFGPSPGWIALAGGRIVGLRMFLRWQWRSNDGRYRAVRAVDTATHPDWRRRGLFAELTSRAVDALGADGPSFVFNTPNRQSGAGYRKMGWMTAPKPPIYALAPGPLRSVRARLGSATGTAKRGSEGGDEPLDPGRFPAIEELFEWPPLDRLLAEYDSDWEPALHTARDRAFLRWRYAEIPGIDYRALAAAAGDDLGAIIFRTRRRRSLRELVISEILTLGPGGSKLVGGLIQRVRGAGIDYLVATARRDSAAAADLRSFGFRRIPWGPVWAVRALGDEPGQEALNRDCWHLSAGDLEIF